MIEIESHEYLLDCKQATRFIIKNNLRYDLKGASLVLIPKFLLWPKVDEKLQEIEEEEKMEQTSLFKKNSLN